MEWVGRFATNIDRLSAVVGRTVAWLTVTIVIVTVYDVLVRYLFKAGSILIQEVEWHLFSANFLLAASWVVQLNGHVRVDLFHSRMHPKQKAWVDLLGGIFFLVPFCAVIVWASIPFVYDSWAIWEGSSDPGGLPARYLLKTVMAVAYILMGLQGVSQIIKNFLILRSKEIES
jgi:TRAP-type mannitol/chloroaromatic compound transport system permease small subunit